MAPLESVLILLQKLNTSGVYVFLPASSKYDLRWSDPFNKGIKFDS